MHSGLIRGVGSGVTRGSQDRVIGRYGSGCETGNLGVNQGVLLTRCVDPIFTRHEHAGANGLVLRLLALGDG